MPILLYLIPIVGIFLLFKSLFGKKEADLSDFYVGGDKTTHETVGDSYGTPTITQSKAKSIAESLYDMLSSPFTSENDILALLSTITESDYILVFKEFGVRKMLRSNLGVFGGIFGNTSIGLDVPFIGKDVTLTDWLNIDIKQNKVKLHALFPNIF